MHKGQILSQLFIVIKSCLMVLIVAIIAVFFVICGQVFIGNFSDTKLSTSDQTLCLYLCSFNAKTEDLQKKGGRNLL